MPATPPSNSNVTRAPGIAAMLRRARFWLDAVIILRPNGFILLAVIAASLLLFSRAEREMETFFDPSAFYAGLAVILGAVITFYLIVIGVPWAWFLLAYYVLRRSRNQILFKFPKDAGSAGEDFLIDAILHRKMRLFFGVIKFKLVFFDYETTDWYYLLRNQKRRGMLFNSADRGAITSVAIRFRHLGRFRTRYSTVKFEDPLGLLSFPIIEREFHPSDKDKNFFLYSLPAAPATPAAPSYVRRANVPSASEQRFRIAEDFFDTKRYEPSDDSRRILWPVYSRMRQLLVRIPERDPVIDADVDAHVLFYRSYFQGSAEELRAGYDSYIAAVMRHLESLMRRRALTIRLCTDSEPEPPYEDDPHLTREENLKRALVSSYWHAAKPPERYLTEVASSRSADRERILIVNPYIAADSFSAEQLALFTSTVLLGCDALDEQPRRSISMLYRDENESILRLLRPPAGRKLKRLRVNRLQLGKMFRET
jgi:hypothetical protein